jgi:hypothetical protein
MRYPNLDMFLFGSKTNPILFKRSQIGCGLITVIKKMDYEKLGWCFVVLQIGFAFTK